MKAISVAAVAAVLGAGFARPSDGGSHPQRYVVQPGDSLWSIADRRYDGDLRQAVWRLRERNGAAAESLEPGDTLLLP